MFVGNLFVGLDEASLIFMVLFHVIDNIIYFLSSGCFVGFEVFSDFILLFFGEFDLAPIYNFAIFFEYFWMFKESFIIIVNLQVFFLFFMFFLWR